MSDDRAEAIFGAAIAADEANGGPVRRLRRTARTDSFSQGAQVQLARYQRRKRGKRLADLERRNATLIRRLFP